MTTIPIEYLDGVIAGVEIGGSVVAKGAFEGFVVLDPHVVSAGGLAQLSAALLAGEKMLALPQGVSSAQVEKKIRLGDEESGAEAAVEDGRRGVGGGRGIEGVRVDGFGAR